MIKVKDGETRVEIGGIGGCFSGCLKLSILFGIFLGVIVAIPVFVIKLINWLI